MSKVGYKEGEKELTSWRVGTGENLLKGEA
ncbi:hypothetical protein J2S00_001920 [Caldalkalibacillus uzonensis]|uniref:Uncharacterized protein n=1 Tax=Caldalkalibacillus uzonensis TaxID=353224 RepID=A0ABU0CS05_9BACI|nr:hypothetical protein [Caldalkalibacillus uzonensis]